MRIVILSHYSTYIFKDILALKKVKNEHPYPWVRNLAEGLALTEVNDVFVITFRSSLKKTQTINVDRVNYIFVKSSPWILRLLSLGLVEVIKLIILLNKIRPDIINSLDLGFYSFCAILSKFNYVITIHGIPREFWRVSRISIKSIIKKKIIYWILNRTKYFIIISPYILNFLKNNKKGNFIYENIENPISRDFFSYKGQLIEKKRQLIWVGTIQDRKGVIELIRIFSLIPNVSLNMVYSYVDYKYLLNVKKIIEEFQLMDRIKFLGYKNEKEIINLLDESYLLLLTSKEETAPMVISEAFARGVPVVSFDIGGISYMISNGETGFTVEYGDFLAFSNRVNKLLSDEELYKNICTKCKEKAISYHPQRIAEKTFLFYKYILKNENKN